MHLDRTIEALGTLLYAVTDQRYRQVTVQLADADGSRVDLHPSTPVTDGGSEQLDFDNVTRYLPPPVRGKIGGQPVRCMSVQAQIRAHSGFELRPQDHHDLAILARLSEVPHLSP